jgi:regulatory protein
MKIVKAKKIGRNRVELIIDNDQKVSLAYEVFLKNQVKLGQEISTEFLSLLLDEDQKYQIKQSALNYLSRRSHSKKEIKTKLNQKKFNPKFIEQTLNYLENNGFLNDNSFARLFAEEKVKTKKWGKNKIKSELIKKGISSEIITDVIDKNFDNEVEIERGIELAQKKFNKLLNHEEDQKKIRSSIYSFLISRGYDYDSCRQIFYRLFKDADLSGF